MFSNRMPICVIIIEFINLSSRYYSCLLEVNINSSEKGGKMQQQPINEFTHRQPSDNAISSPIFDCPTEEEVELETKTKEEQGLPRLAVPFAFPEAPPFIPGGKPKVDCLDNESESQARARIIITKCIEEGNDNIDLSYVICSIPFFVALRVQNADHIYS